MKKKARFSTLVLHVFITVTITEETKQWLSAAKIPLDCLYKFLQEYDR